MVNDHPQGSSGTFTTDDDQLTLAEPEFNSELTYRWSLENGVLSLSLLENSAGPDDEPGVRMATEHDLAMATE
jgi:hypothetical protein